jgi:hypothetical protein
VKTQAKRVRPPSAAVIVGIDVVTTVPSKALITRPTSTAPNASRRRLRKTGETAVMAAAAVALMRWEVTRTLGCENCIGRIDGMRNRYTLPG